MLLDSDESRRQKRFASITLLFAAVVLGVVTFLAIAHGGKNPIPGRLTLAPTFTMQGVIELDSGYPATVEETSAGGCQGMGGYGDLTLGTAVTVADPQGHVVATGKLTTGEPQMTQIDAPALGLPPQNVVASCTLAFVVPNVPEGLASYAVTISHRGTQVFEATAAHDEIQLQLGG